VTADDDGRVYLSLGETAIRLREPLAHLAVTVADRASDLDNPWLFPGAEGPVTSEQLRQRLAMLGMDRVLLAATAPGRRWPPIPRRRCWPTNSGSRSRPRLPGHKPSAQRVRIMPG